MFCGNCGSAISEGSGFCPACGARVPTGTAAAPPPIPPPVQQPQPPPAYGQPPYPPPAPPPVYGQPPAQPPQPPPLVYGQPPYPPPTPPTSYVPPPLQPMAPAMDYAQWGTRAIGYLIDSVLVGGVALILYLVLGGLMTAMIGSLDENAATAMCCLALLLFPLATLLVGLYNRVYLVAKRGASIGQGVVKVKVVNANGQLLSQGTAFVRLLAQAGMGLIPILPLLDLLWPLWDERRQTLHDKAVSCYVINNPQGR